MNLFSKINLENGTKTNAILGLVFSILTVVAAGLYFIFGMNALVFAAIFFLVGIIQVKKGLNSDAPKMAKIARPIIWLGAVLVAALCVWSVISFAMRLLK